MSSDTRSQRRRRGRVWIAASLGGWSAATSRMALALPIGVSLFLGTLAYASASESGAGRPFTFYEASPESSAVPTSAAGPPASSDRLGSSAWTYRDSRDSDAKSEGSYSPFGDQQDERYGYPHGGYSTTSNKCGVCHAVHRASGSFALVRVDSPDDSCSYCHVGPHRHASKRAYFRDTDGIYAANGHTIGGGPEIPRSSVWQWTEETTVAKSGEATAAVQLPESRLGWIRSAMASDTESESITVRKFEPQPNRIMRYTVHGGRFIRVGPTYLRCSSCHQVHNASRQIWKPLSSKTGQRLEAGYKLLRDSPSAGVSVNPSDIEPDGRLASSGQGPRALTRRGFSYYDPGAGASADGLSDPAEDYRLRVLETTISPATGLSADGSEVVAPSLTGYTRYRYVASETSTSVPAELPVYETSLSVWCADCHNLTISGARQRNDGGFGPESKLHAIPHTTPGMLEEGTSGASGSQCYDCHSNDMPRDARLDPCGGCHISPPMYRYYKNGEAVYGKTWAERVAEEDRPYPAESDFPHSGPSASIALLQARDRIGAETTSNPTDWDGKSFDASADALAKICRSCHKPGAYHSEVYGQ